VKVAPGKLEKIRIKRPDVHGNWNHTIRSIKRNR